VAPIRASEDPLTTAAAIDRVVHHSIIVEFGREIKSFRAEEAARRTGIERDGANSSVTAGPSTAAQDAAWCVLAWAFLIVVDGHF